MSARENFGSKTLNEIPHCVLSSLSLAHFIFLFFLPRPLRVAHVYLRQRY